MLINVAFLMSEFVENALKLSLHPKKTFITTYASGIDFLGWTHFPYHRSLRTVTKRRVLKRLAGDEVTKSIKQSYLGLLSHGDTYGLRKVVGYL
jgi:hypothetical protein